MKFDLEAVNKVIHPMRLTPRQFDILKLRLYGYTYKQIAEELNLSEPTIYTRMQEVRWAVGLPYQCRGSRELIAWAIEHGLMEIRL